MTWLNRGGRRPGFRPVLLCILPSGPVFSGSANGFPAKKDYIWVKVIFLGLSAFFMEENVGLMDQKVRIAVGAVLGLLSLGILFTSMIPLPEVASPVLGVVSIILLATGYFRKCALYQVLGISTNEK